MMEKVSQKGMDLGSLKRTLAILKFSPTIKSRSSYTVNMGWEGILPLEIYCNVPRVWPLHTTYELT